VTLVSSCSDFLDKEPLTSFSSENFWKTEQDVQAALAATYSTHRTSVFGATRGSNGVSFAIEATSDNAISTSGYAGYNNILQGGINPGTGGAINQFWSDSYNGIAKCNYFLDNIDRAKGFFNNRKLYDNIKVRALFNRCYFYNELIQLYGDVPLVLVSQDAGSGYESVPRTPKADIVTQLLSDIDVAIAGLPNVAYTDGHVVKGSAIMLKVRILMNNALDNTSFYTQAAETAWSLIGDPANPFELSGNYSGHFLQRSKR
jgi:prepilin-type processing-associated H-X9-DG protein